jgi:DNA modification methylase
VTGTSVGKVKQLPGRFSPLGRLNSICPYFTMFPIQFPFEILKKARPRDLVLDPFCGRGTTVYAARLLGLDAVGIDVSPVAAAIASSKLVQVTPAEVELACRRILSRKVTTVELPEEEFWHWCYHPKTLIEICILRDYLRSKRELTQPEIALRALMLGLLHGPLCKTRPSYLSNQMPRTYSTKPEPALTYWDAREMRPPRVHTLELVSRKAKYVFEQLPPATEGSIRCADARAPMNLNKNISWVVTSPPYLGMKSYLPDQWLRRWFLGGDEDVDYTQAGQIGFQKSSTFITQLATVWKRVADACISGAHLIMRFGALPSIKADPAEIIRRSLAEANAGWEISTIKLVPNPPKNRRQASQFVGPKSKFISEYDVVAVLGT